MRPFIGVTFSVLALALPLHAQTAADSSGIRAAALDYGQGWYEGNAERMDRALHPELVKRIVVLDTVSKKAQVDGMGKTVLVNYTRRGFGTRTPEARRKADAAAGRVHELEAELGELDGELEELERDRAAAEAELERLRAQVQTVAVDRYTRAKNLSRGTRDGYACTLGKWKRWGGGPSLERLTRGQVREFLDWVYDEAVTNEGNNPGRTANKARANLQAILSWAWEQEIIESLPRLPRPKAQRDVAGRHYLTKGELNSLYFATYSMRQPQGWGQEGHRSARGAYRCAARHHRAREGFVQR